MKSNRRFVDSTMGRLLYPLYNLRIGLRLGVAFCGVFVLMTLMAVFATVNMGKLNARMVHVTSGNMEQTARVNTMIESVSLRAVAVRNLTLLKDPALKKEELDSIKQAEESYINAEIELLALIEKYSASEAEKALLEAIKRSEKTVTALMAEAIELGMADKTEEAVTFLMEKVRPRQVRWVTVLQTLSGLQAKTSAEYTQEAGIAYVNTRNLMVGFVVIALMGGVVLAWLVTRSITAPIQEAMGLAERAAQGDLTTRQVSRRGDEMGKLLGAMTSMNENLVRVVGEVRLGSENIATGTAEIATGNNDLSHRTEQQAASLEETAASMEEIRSAVRNNADTAREASQMAESASTVASKGGQVMSEVIKTMEDITTSSKRIGDIIGVIDGIAFQTNILALNAAVEAARAGEQGRGFAVVASEVRALAGRSAEAAREIKGLISVSAESVGRGSQLVTAAGGTMGDIVAQVKRVASLISEISSATAQQTTGIDQVSDAVGDLDRVTQQNAALVEEAAAAAESLKSQAARLLEAVSVFKLDTA